MNHCRAERLAYLNAKYGPVQDEVCDEEHFWPNPFRTEGDIAILMLTLCKESKIDMGDLVLAQRFRWRTQPTAPGVVYAAANVRDKDGRRTTLYLHRLIIGSGGLPGADVDHINHDTLDNRRANLRFATRSENGHNRAGINSNNKTGVRGVSVARVAGRAVYYAFRCQTRACPVVAYFPLTNEGLAAASKQSTEHYLQVG